MNSRTVVFAVAAALLVVFRLGIYWAKRRGHNLFVPVSGEADRWSLSHLLVASFLTLFAELSFIRWLAVEVRVFAYFKNLALLLCFLGFGLGCALARSRVRWWASVMAFLGLLLVVRWPDHEPLEGLSQTLGTAQDLEIWHLLLNWTWATFFLGVALAGVLLLLLVWIFVPLGQKVSRQMDLAPSILNAYSWNLVGSLAGILAFFLVCRLMLSPSVWMGGILLGFALLQSSRKEQLVMASLLVPAILLLHDPAARDRSTFWTPYQLIEMKRIHFPNGDLLGANIAVNRIGYQTIVNLSPPFLARHPGLIREAAEDNPYNLPFRFAAPNPSVLVVGAGSGNDVAAALRHGSRSVDAVDIDPAIIQLGKREHPEHPYDSPRVTIHLTDARAFLKRASHRYDLILFGLLDSHTQFSDYSNMRIDNFVYTMESLREARRLLNPDGVLFIKFHPGRPWIGQRLQEMLTRTFGKPPVVFFADSTYTVVANCFVVSNSGRVEEALTADPELANFVRSGVTFAPNDRVSITTDDWPYLYHEGHWIPRAYYSLAILVALIALGLYWQIPEARRRVPSMFFFAMGAGFLLLETQVISRLALYFGTTWQVNGIVIAALLTTLLLANGVTERRRKPWPRSLILAGLLAGLGFAYWLPLDRMPGSATVVGSIAAVAFSVPIFFAGLLFAREFRTTDSPSAALGANMLGAVVGGLLENLSLVIGMRSLLLVAMALYCIAGVALWRPRKLPANAPQEEVGVIGA
jgi:spermidine synthase